MATIGNISNQGTTLAWTEAYGARSTAARIEQVLKDVFFAITLAVFLSGVLGFLTYEGPSARVTRAAQTTL